MFKTMNVIIPEFNFPLKNSSFNKSCSSGNRNLMNVFCVLLYYRSFYNITKLTHVGINSIFIQRQTFQTFILYLPDSFVIK